MVSQQQSDRQQVCEVELWVVFMRIFVSLSLRCYKILLSTDSETFDLAGKNASTIENAVKDAFQDPFPLVETIRLTFVTGAGKLARQKYDEGAAKAITSNLRELGYEEDQSGGPGTFKLQHDTGKNLKTVVVHPKVVGGVDDVQAGVDSLNVAEKSSLLQFDSPEHKIAYASSNVFERMITSMCPSWSQKKGCIAVIDDIKVICKKLDEKLLSGQPLDDAEQTFYDDVSLSKLDEKQASIRQMMQKQVDDGQITAEERQQLLSQVTERLEKLQSEKAEAEKSGKPKRVENLSAAIDKATERNKKLEQTADRAPHPLKHQAKINSLRKELAPLLEMERTAKGRLLSLKETQAMGRKEEIEQEIEELELSSRGWFESNEAFDKRVETSKASFKAPAKKKAAPKASVAKAPARTAWSTPASRKQPAAKPKKKTSTGNGARGVFAAMMMDSDSE